MGSDSSGEKKQLGRILLKQKLVSPDELDDLLSQQKQTPGQRLGSAVVSSGKVSGVKLLEALSEQHGVPGIDLTQVVVPLDNLELIPAEIARQHLILPIVVKDDRLFLAMADPEERRIIDEIEFVTGCRVFPYVALHDPLRHVIDEAYRLAERGERYYIGPNAPDEYLQQLGLSRDASPSQPAVAPSSPPEPRPEQQHGVVTEPTAAAPHGGDELGLATLQEQENAALEPPAQRSDGAKGSTRSRSGEPAVLVVDDEDDIRRLLRRVMSEKGYHVIEASKGIEALQAVRDHVPDVILLDAMLPEVHGFEICRRIKGSKRYGNIPIIMVSAVYRGWRFAEDLKQSYGVEDFLEKPFKIAEVLSAVERAVQGAAQCEPPPEDDELGREASETLRLGMDAYRNGDLDGAIAKLKEGLRVDPLSFQLHYHLGLLYGRRDDLFDAIHELETSVDLQPRNFSALKNLAVLYQRTGFKHKATEMWERALGSAPDEETRRGIKDHLMSLL